MRLKEMRKKAGLTARDIANATGVSIQNVYNWEANSYAPEAAKLIQISELCHCTLDELMKDDK